jgi:hypothetical protein
MQTDPTKATVWINNSSLPPETKTSLLQSGGSGRGAAPPPRVFVPGAAAPYYIDTGSGTVIFR